jgi:alpha-N-arabinofuranosidase
MTENGGGSFKQTIFYPYMHTSVFGRGVSLKPILNVPKYDSKDFTDVPYLDAAAVHNEEEDELTIFIVNKHVREAMPLDIDLRSFEGYKLIEHIELYHDDVKAVNTMTSEAVKPTHNNETTFELGQLSAQLKKTSWNVIRLKK